MIGSKVSVVIPVFNGANYLREAIESILAQTYQNLEILVINDGSSDGGVTEGIAMSYGDRIRYFYKENGGVASALNLAIEKMTGDYLSWLSHDDLYCEDKVEAQVDALSKVDNPLCILYSDYSIFSENPDDAVPVRFRSVDPEQFRYWMTIENTLHGCTLLIPKEAIDKVGRFNEKLRTTQDYEFWFRLAEVYPFIHIPKVLVYARLHPEQGSAQSGNLAYDENIRLYSDFVTRLTRTELLLAGNGNLSKAYAMIASSMWCRGFIPVARLAVQLVWQNMSKCLMWERSEILLILVSGKVQYYIYRLLRETFPPVVRAQLKSLIRRIY